MTGHRDSALRVSATATGIRLSVRVQPRSSRPGVGGLHGDALKVRVAAAPVDGAANDAVIDALAEAFSVSRRAVRLVSGASSRSKVLDVDDATLAAAQRLAAGD